MWPTVTIIASALMGVGVGLVTSEAPGQSHLSAVSRQATLRATITCQMRPDLRLVATEQCQGDAAHREPCSYHGFMSLSDDLNSCSLIGAGAVDDHLRFTPYCNDTQMAACAEATGSFWGHDGSTTRHAEASAAPIIQLVVVPLVDLKLGADAGFDGMLIPSVAPPIKSLAPLHKPIHSSPRGVRQAAIYSEPVNGDGPYRSSQKDRTAAHLEAVVRVDMAAETAHNSAPGPRAPAQEAEPATSASEQPGVSKPTGSGNKHLVGMVAALGTVMLIFVVWL